ncbi:MAG: transporter substrate-binding domain-containing protein [Gammaproteobacteria bacterium]|nr:transporter substrate-binding domain-containing protein [Gammaproteobacteria bacterium]
MINIKEIPLKTLLLTVFFSISTPLVSGETTVTLASRDNSVINSVTEPVLIEAYRRIGIKVEFNRLPGNRSIVVANNGLTDGEVGRLKYVLSQHENLLIVPTPILFSRLSAFTKMADPKVYGWPSLKNYSVAALGSFKFVVNKLQNHPQTILTNDAASALSLVHNGQVDIAILNQFEGKRLVDVFGYREIYAAEPPLVNQPIHHLLHKKNEHLIQPLNDSLNEMVKDGTLHRIWAEHGFSK